ncbi:uncharacterized protein V6R79_013801 [Siganus canaliculatus]
MSTPRRGAAPVSAWSCNESGLRASEQRVQSSFNDEPSSGASSKRTVTSLSGSRSVAAVCSAFPSPSTSTTPGPAASAPPAPAQKNPPGVDGCRLGLMGNALPCGPLALIGCSVQTDADAAAAFAIDSGAPLAPALAARRRLFRGPEPSSSDVSVRSTAATLGANDANSNQKHTLASSFGFKQTTLFRTGSETRQKHDHFLSQRSDLEEAPVGGSPSLPTGDRL